MRDGQKVEVEVDAPGEVEGPIRRGARLGTADGLRRRPARRARCRCAPAARFPRRARFDRVRDFVGNNLIPIAIAVFVILMGGVLLLPPAVPPNDEEERTGWTPK